jgi:O-acetyl-ADP-ribose deacetylase (regulator of RNase III)
MRVEVVASDLSRVEGADAIVSPTNTGFSEDGWLASLLMKRGGERVRAALREQDPLPLGGVVETTAGDLPARYLLHAAVVGLRAEDLTGERERGTLTSAKVLYDATVNALETASSLGCETVAVPLLGGGLAMYPERPCADVMVRALRDYRRGFPDSAVKVVWLVGRMENELDALEAALDAAPELRAARDDSPNATALPT